MVLLWIIAVAIIAVIFFGFIWLVQFAWNELMPMLFNLPELTYWQALGIYFLASALIKSTLSLRSK